MRGSWTPSIVPNGDDQTVYIVLDNFGNRGCAWRGPVDRHQRTGGLAAASNPPGDLHHQWSLLIRPSVQDLTRKWWGTRQSEMPALVRPQAYRAGETAPAIPLPGPFLLAPAAGN
jgi:hypothetical protein